MNVWRGMSKSAKALVVWTSCIMGIFVYINLHMSAMKESSGQIHIFGSNPHSDQQSGETVLCIESNNMSKVCLEHGRLDQAIDLIRERALKELSVIHPHDLEESDDIGDTLVDVIPHGGASVRHTSLNMRSTDKKTKFEGLLDMGLSKECRDRYYGDLTGWPTASIMIAFCENELLVDILHTVHSVIQRSPEQLLLEVILIDDNSKRADLKEILENYCNVVFGGKVRILRSDVTLGLIKARLLGARAAKGDIIVSMDAHMEVQHLWLEALIYEILQDRGTLATAMLDWMMPNEDGTWRYRNGVNSYICFFSWDMVFGFGFARPELQEIWKQNRTQAIPSPCSVGTIWAMNRAFFTEIGELDEGMEMWGGENLDLPIRAWLFGGRAVQVPCSHAAHLERPHMRDYRYGMEKSMLRNYKRVAEVWFDEYKKHLYRAKPEAKDIEAGDLTDRLALKKRAVHDFGWFLSNIYPELGLYDNDTFGYDWLQNVGSQKCIHRVAGSPLRMWACLGQPIKEGIFLTTDGYLRTDVHTWHAKGKKQGSLVYPEGMSGTYHAIWLSKWIHWKNGPMMLYESDGRSTSKNLCLEPIQDQTVALQPCDPNNKMQRWQWKTYSDDYEAFITGRSGTKYDLDYHKQLLSKKTEWDIK